MVPMLTCGLVRSNFAFATSLVLLDLFSTPSVLATAVLGSVVRNHSWNYPSSPHRIGLLAGCLGDDLLRDVRGNLGVGVELHGVVRPALSLRPQVADVAEHLRERHQRLDDAGAGPLLHGLDLTTAGVQVADDVTHVRLRRGHL